LLAIAMFQVLEVVKEVGRRRRVRVGRSSVLREKWGGLPNESKQKPQVKRRKKSGERNLASAERRLYIWYLQESE